MQGSPQVNSAIDAVRCLYLARVAERKGHADAAQRWQQMVTRWLNRLEPNTNQCGPSAPTTSSVDEAVLDIDLDPMDDELLEDLASSVL